MQTIRQTIKKYCTFIKWSLYLHMSPRHKKPARLKNIPTPNEGTGKLSSNASQNPVNEFLDSFSLMPAAPQPRAQLPKTSKALLDEIQLNHFYWPPADISEEKIKHFGRIARRIEKQLLSQPEQYRHDPDYKVEYRQVLNQAQLTAVSTLRGPILVIAGAGSGKTRTLTYRVSYLLENGISPEKILLLTFTRKASAEMINRTMALLKSPGAKKVAGGTFHSFANYALRRFSGLARIEPDFTVIDTTDAEDIIALIREENVFRKSKTAGPNRAFPKKERIYEIISASKNRDQSITDIIETRYSGLADYIPDIETIAEVFDQYKRANRLFDYDDLIDRFVSIMSENEKFRNKIQETWDYVMVDEYQDTNIRQKEMVNLIAQKKRNLMVVGDDAQSIYSFRGANFENILEFPETYPDCGVVKIEENYRSIRGVLEFANAVISNVKIGYRKKLITENRDSAKPLFQSFYDQEAEAQWIVTKILELRDRDIELKNIAVLVRAMYHSNYIQIELLKRGIPYVVVGGIKFSERKHIRDMIAFLRVLHNPYDAPAWNRILKLIEGIGDVSSKNIILTVRGNGGILNPEIYRSKKYYQDIRTLAVLLAGATKMLEANAAEIQVAGLIEKIRGFYTPLLKKRESDYNERLRDIEVLYNFSANYTNLEKFLTEFVLDPPSGKFQDRNEPLIDEGEDTPLTISTVHSAKGLEWHSVFIPHLLDGLFPSVRSIETLEDLEEERRLFYVACTRAKAGLFFTMPSFFAAWDAVMTLPSRFLAEVPKTKWDYAP